MTTKYKVVKISRFVGAHGTPEEVEEFAKIDAEIVEVADSNKSQVIEAVKDADIFLQGDVLIPRLIMESAPKCRAIMTSAVGFDRIDIDAATDNNILVVNNPSFEWCVEEVSNHAILLILACAKKMKILDNLASHGHWSEARKMRVPMGSIYGQTLGIIGCGSIGRMVARKAKCFGLKVIGYDPYVENYLAKENGITLVNLGELLSESDYVSAHPDLNATSRHLMSEKEFRQMKTSAFFINTSRGQIVDEPAIIKALEQKWIAGAALDVFEKEPVDKDNPLLNMSNVIILPHTASYSDYAFSLAPQNIVKEAGRVLSGKWPNNVVNKSVKPKFTLVKDN